MTFGTEPKSILAAQLGGTRAPVQEEGTLHDLVLPLFNNLPGRKHEQQQQQQQHARTLRRMQMLMTRYSRRFPLDRDRPPPPGIPKRNGVSARPHVRGRTRRGSHSRRRVIQMGGFFPTDRQNSYTVGADVAKACSKLVPTPRGSASFEMGILVYSARATPCGRSCRRATC